MMKEPHSKRPARRGAARAPKRNTLATYLAARTSHRFQMRRRQLRNVHLWRAWMIVVLITILAIGLWGAWRELGF